MSPQRLLLLLSLVAALGCRGAAPVVDSEGSANAGSGAPQSPGTSLQPTAEGTGAAAVPTAEPAAARAAEPAPLVDLVALMREVGFADARPEDLAQYVPVPPGAVGAAGSFAGPEGEVRVALIRYANPNYVRPHLSDLEERRRVIEQLAEAWANDATTVLHVKAIDRATAERVRDAIVARLGWSD